MTDPVDERKRATLRRFAALGAAAPFVGSADAADGDGTDANETREAIRGYVATTPGAHFSKLRDELQLGTGEAQYHLGRLEESNAVESIKDGEFRRFYAANQFDQFERTALGYLRRDTPRTLLLELLRDPSAGASDVASAAGVSRASVSSAAADLETAGLLDRTGGYTPRRPETLALLVVRYAASFDEDAVAFAANADDYLQYDPSE